MKVATVLLHLAAALVFVAPALAAEPVRIGVSLGPTGKYKGPSEMQRRAYELWRDEVNGRGGLLERPLILVIRDDGGDAAQAAQIYREFTDREPVDLVFGPYSSALTAAVAPIVDKAGYPMLAAGASADAIWQNGYDNVFGMWTPASRYVYGMLELASDSDLKTVAILHADDAFSENVAAGARKWAPYLGLKVVADIRFAKGTADLTGPVRQARDAGVELLVIAGHFNEAANARRALAGEGWMPRAFFATVGPALPGWLGAMGAEADCAFATSIWEPHKAVTYPRSQEFTNAFRQGNDGTDPSYHAATAYAAGQILEAAVARAQSLDREAIRAALFELDTYSVIGRYGVDHTGMQVKRLEMIVQWRQGRKEIVWPDEIKSRDAVFGEECG
jgi:branched-chain amino acid transport system substrate-binding protein